MSEHATRSSTDVYNRLHDDPDFTELRRRYRSFAIPWTIAFFAWYMLYVAMSNWAHGFMSHQLVGNINVALVFGLLQFASTFLIAWLYSRHAGKQLDPLAERLDAKFEQEIAR